MTARAEGEGGWERGREGGGKTERARERGGEGERERGREGERERETAVHEASEGERDNRLRDLKGRKR